MARIFGSPIRCLGFWTGIAMLAWGWLLIAPFSAVSWLMSDDAFYYFMTAENLFTLGQPSFDGFTITSGFHPLWLLICTPIFGLCGRTLLPLRIIIALQILLFSGTITFVSLVGYRKYGSVGALATGALLLLYPLYSNIWLSGIEGALFCFVLSAVMYVLSLKGFGESILAGSLTPIPALLLGLLVGVATLARLEALFLALAILIFLLCAKPLLHYPRRITSILCFIVGVAVMLTPYFTWLYSNFGQLQPISGLTKRLWARDNLREFVTMPITNKLGAIADNAVFDNPFIDPLRLVAATTGAVWGLTARNVVLCILLLLLLVVAYRYKHLWLPQLLDLHIQCFLVYTLVVYLYYAVFSFGVHRDWYFCPEMLVTGLIVGIGFSYLNRLPYTHLRVPTISALIILLLLGNIAQAIRLSHLYNADQCSSPDVQTFVPGSARMIDQYVPQGARVGSFDAGYAAYFAHRTVTNLDGLINGVALYRCQSEHRLVDWILANNVEYIYNGGSPRQLLSNKLVRFDSLSRWRAVLKLVAYEEGRTLWRVEAPETRDF